jgi:tape measure domain-containing protein
LNNAESRLSKFGQRAEKIGTSLSLAISAPLALVGKNALQTSAQFESLEMSFGTMLRSMENGKTLMKDLQNYNLATSFQFEEVAGAGKSLLAFGFAQQQIIPQMKMIGDISAGVGINIKDLAEIYGKARVQGRLFAEDINQLTGRGIPIIAELAKQFGVSEQAVKKLTEDGKIGFNNLEKAFASMTSTGGQFFNMTANQSTTLSGLYSNLQDSVTMNLRTIGDSIVKNLDLKTVIPQASKYLTDLAEGFSKLSPEAQKAIVVIGGLAIVLPPLLALAGTVLPAIATGFTALISPAGLATVAIAGLVAIVAEHYLTTNKMLAASNSYANISKEVSKSISTEVTQVAKLKDVLDSNVTSLDDKKKALEELKKINPEYFGGLKAENLNYSELNKGISKYIDNLQKAAEAKKITDSIISNNDLLKSFGGDGNKTLSSFEKSRNYGIGAVTLNSLQGNKSLNDLQGTTRISEIESANKKLQDRLNILNKEGYGKDLNTATGGGGKGSGSGTGGGGMSNEDKEKRKKLLEELAKEEERILGETFSLRKTMQSQTRDLIIASMEDETKRAKAEAQKRAEEEISAMREKMIGLKDLESEFANWRLQREQTLANELVKIQRESFIVPQEIKRTMIADVMNSVEPKDRKKVTNDVMQNRLERSIMLGTKGIQSEQDRGAVGKVLGMDIGIEQWQSDSATYIAAAQGIIDANSRIKNSVGEIALAAGEAMGATIAQMAMGTATITDLANSLLSAVGGIFADMLKQLAIAQAKLILVKSIIDPTALLKTVGLAAGAGLLGAFSSKIGQNRAGNQTQRNNSQPSYSVTRGSDIYTASKRYETIKGF